MRRTDVVTPGGRLAIKVGLCASLLYGCGVSDRPLNVLSGVDPSSNGGAQSTGGASSTGGSNSNGGAPSTGGTVSTIGSGGVPLGGGPNGGVPIGGNGNGGTPPIGTGGIGVGGSGPDTTPSVTGPATTTAGGVLTNLRGGSFVPSGSLVITTLYAKIEILSSFNSIQLWGDIENRGTSVECIPLATLAINGYDILTVAYGPAYQLSGSIASACLTPGAKGAIHGIDNAVSATLLSGSSNSVAYSFQTLIRPTAIPHPGAPTLLTGTVGLDSFGQYAVSGNIRGGSVDVYNMSLDFFMRDSSGLLRADESAFPNDLGTVIANSVVPYESSGIDDRFSRYLQFPDFIEGVAANFIISPPSEYTARADSLKLVRQRLADVAVARRIIRR